MKSKILASITTFFIPVMLIGLLLQAYYGINLFTQGVIISMLLLAIMPYLIHHSYHLMKDFFDSNKNIFRNEKQWYKLRKEELERFQSKKYIPFGCAFSIIITYIILKTSFIGASPLILIWSMISFFTLFLVASQGFWLIYVLITMLNKICDLNLVFKPLHPDSYGGLSALGNISIKGIEYFSTGALLFPLIFEILGKISPLGYAEAIIFMVWILFFLYVIFLIAGFFMPIFKIKNVIGGKTEDAIEKSDQKLEKMMKEFQKNKDPKYASEIELYMKIYHERLFTIKEYPFDMSTIMEYLFAMIVPTIIGILQWMAMTG